MNVLMFGWEYPPHISGGLGVACHAIVQALLNKNVNINLILPSELRGSSIKKGRLQIIGLDDRRAYGNPFASKSKIYKIDSLLHPYLTTDEYKKNVDPINIRNIYEKFKSNLACKYSACEDAQNLDADLFSVQYGHNLFDEVLRYARIAGDLAQHVPHDIIHAHDWMTILAGIKAKNLSNKKLIFHVHALEVDRSGLENINRQIFDIEKYGMEQADKIVTVSNYTKSIITQHYGISAAKIEVVHNGIDSAYSTHNSKNIDTRANKTVLFLGRITHQKGPYQFVEIADKILGKRSDVDFVIAGTGNLLIEMIEKVAAMRIGKHVHFTGFLHSKMVKRMFRKADVYVMPSVSEPFGLSCLEALANDVPVVISKQSGVIETLQHVLYADFWDIDEMAAKILALLDYRALSKELLLNARREMKNITWERTGDKLIQLYLHSRCNYRSISGESSAQTWR